MSLPSWLHPHFLRGRLFLPLTSFQLIASILISLDLLCQRKEQVGPFLFSSWRVWSLSLFSHLTKELNFKKQIAFQDREFKIQVYYISILSSKIEYFSLLLTTKKHLKTRNLNEKTTERKRKDPNNKGMCCIFWAGLICHLQFWFAVTIALCSLARRLVEGSITLQSRQFQAKSHFQSELQCNEVNILQPLKLRPIS